MDETLKIWNDVTSGTLSSHRSDAGDVRIRVPNVDRVAKEKAPVRKVKHDVKTLLLMGIFLLTFVSNALLTLRWLNADLKSIDLPKVPEWVWDAHRSDPAEPMNKPYDRGKRIDEGERTWSKALLNEASEELNFHLRQMTVVVCEGCSKKSLQAGLDGQSVDSKLETWLRSKLTLAVKAEKPDGSPMEASVALDRWLWERMIASARAAFLEASSYRCCCRDTDSNAKELCSNTVYGDKNNVDIATNGKKNSLTCRVFSDEVAGKASVRIDLPDSLETDIKTQFSTNRWKCSVQAVVDVNKED